MRERISPQPQPHLNEKKKLKDERSVTYKDYELGGGIHLSLTKVEGYLF